MKPIYLCVNECFSVGHGDDKFIFHSKKSLNKHILAPMLVQLTGYLLCPWQRPYIELFWK